MRELEDFREIEGIRNISDKEKCYFYICFFNLWKGLSEIDSAFL